MKISGTFGEVTISRAKKGNRPAHLAATYEFAWNDGHVMYLYVTRLIDQYLRHALDDPSQVAPDDEIVATLIDTARHGMCQCCAKEWLDRQDRAMSEGR